jgi:hypothetical protein
MKLLLNHEGSYYVVDLESLKPLSVVEVVTAAGDDSLVLADMRTLPETSLIALLTKALDQTQTSAPRTTRTTRTTTATDYSGARGWYSGLSDAEKAKITPDGKTLSDKGAIPVWLREAYDAK